MLNRILALAAGMVMLLTPCMALAAEEYPVDVSGLKAAVLIEQASGSEALNYNGNEKLEAGGLARLPALLAACRRIDDGGLSLEDKVTVSAAAARASGPTAFLEANESATISMLLKAAVMICAGDAIYALGEAAYGSPEACNQEAGEILYNLGVEGGYNYMAGEGQYSAAELAAIGAELMKSRCFSLYSSLYYDRIQHEDGRETELASSNKLLKSCTGTAGVATGSSNDAGYCGVFGVKRGNSSYVCAVLGAGSSAKRAESAQSMLEYAFAAYDTRVLARAGEVIVPAVPVKGGVLGTVDLVAREDAVALLPKNAGLEEERKIPEELTAPLVKEDTVGSIVYSCGGEALAGVGLFPAMDIEAARTADYVKMALLEWLHT